MQRRSMLRRMMFCRQKSCQICTVICYVGQPADNKSMMADQCPNKNDIVAIFKRLRNIPANKVCFDCNAKNPTWSSVTYGVFICIDCSAVHRGLGVHLTFVRSTQLDTNWTWIQLRQMQMGGNGNASTFFRQHNSTSNDAQQKYNSRAAQLYRDKLHQSAVQAMRIHGTQVHLDSATEPPAAEEKEVDFFDELTSPQSALSLPATEAPPLITASILKPAAKKPEGDTREPNVDMILSADPPQVVERKSTIGGRKPAARKGLGAKKGLGAQRVKANFDDIEREALMNDEMKEKVEEESKKDFEEKAEDEEKHLASMRLAYQDLGLKQKKEEEKMKQTDPKKAKQMERLGMGFSNRSGISHSALSDMKTIEQEGVVDKKPTVPSSSRGSSSMESDFFDDFQSGFSMYKGGNQTSESKSMNWGSFDNGSKDRSGGSSSKGWTDQEPRRASSPQRRSSPVRSSSSRQSREPTSSASGDEAQKKFGSAKAISSDQFFQDANSNDWERKTNLQRFEGSSSISSSDYFNNGQPTQRGSSSSNSGGGYQPSMQSPDLDDMKESVRQGVTKVAGKLSNLANGVMNSFQNGIVSNLQERYGY